MAKRPEKKSESLEIRLPYSQKTAFVKACQEQGLSASEALRAQIDQFMQSGEAPQKPNFLGATLNMIERHKKKTVTAIACAVSALTIGFALPSAADSELFKSYDRNGDGVLTAGEISASDSAVLAILDKDKSGTITAEEFEETAEVTEIRDFTSPGGTDGAPAKRFVEVKNTHFRLDGSDDVKVYVQNWMKEVPLNASQTDINNIAEGLKTQLEAVEDYDNLDEMEAAERARIQAEIESHAGLRTMVRMKQLETSEAELMEHLKHLQGLEIDLSDLSELEELEGLAELQNMELDISIDLDLSRTLAELEAELSSLAEQEASVTSELAQAKIREARKHVERVREALRDMKNVRRVFVLRSENPEDGEPVNMKREITIQHNVQGEAEIHSETHN